MGHAAPKPIVFPDAQGAELPEGNNGPCVQWARRGAYPAGCSTMARTKRTAQATWEALASPRHIPVLRRAGDPSPTHDTFAGARVVGPRGTEQAPASR